MTPKVTYYKLFVAVILNSSIHFYNFFTNIFHIFFSWEFLKHITILKIEWITEEHYFNLQMCVYKRSNEITWCLCYLTRSSSPLEFQNSTTIFEDCPSDETQLVTKVVYAIWVWAIFLTFPGTYSMQPAVTTHTFGHKWVGLLYSLLKFLTAAMPS